MKKKKTKIYSLEEFGYRKVDHKNFIDFRNELDSKYYGNYIISIRLWKKEKLVEIMATKDESFVGVNLCVDEINAIHKTMEALWTEKHEEQL